MHKCVPVSTVAVWRCTEASVCCGRLTALLLALLVVPKVEQRAVSAARPTRQPRVLIEHELPCQFQNSESAFHSFSLLS
eukprot:COSAG06_NODE_471_length_15318_cov_24.861029_14_plen_79_part_00